MKIREIISNILVSKQIFQIMRKLGESVSFTGSSKTVPLKSMEMGELQDHLVEGLEEEQMKTELESLSDDELILKVSKKPARKTLLRVQRFRHRPLEVVVDVDYKKAEQSKDVLRKRKSTSQNMFSYRWIWLLLIFGGAIVGIVNLLETWISNLFGNSGNQLTQIQLIVTVVVLTTVVAVSWIYGVPYLMRQKHSKLREFDMRVLEIVSSKIEAIDESMVDTEVIRCWSCFELLSAGTMICPQCGKNQN